MWYLTEEEVESLLMREARARLPLLRQFLLYLDPFALFKDASRGPASVRTRAYSYNRQMRNMLLPYIRRWAAIAAGFILSIEPAQAFAAQTSSLIIPATLGVGCCLAVTVIACTLASYFLLGASSHAT